MDENGAPERLNIVFLCLDDEYAGEMQKPLYEKCPDLIRGVVISRTYYGRAGIFKTAWQIFKSSGLRYLFHMAYLKIVKAREAKKKTSPAKLADKYNVRRIYVDNINSKKSLKEIAELNPDIFIATNFNQFVGKSARNLPRMDTLNMHKAYLPKHRGMAPSFYSLLEGDEYTGVSLHRMEKDIDAGNILKQEKIEITLSDTVSSLNEKAAIAGGHLLVEFIEEVMEKNRIPPGTPQDETLADEHTFPAKHEVKDFIRKNLKFY